MNTSKKNRLFVVAVPILLVITMVLVASVWARSNPCTETLSNNQSMNLGILTVWHDETALYVEYNTMSAQELDIPDGWEIAETRLAIGGIRQANSDDSMPGQFPFHEKHDPPIRKYTYIVEFNEWDADLEEFYVAAQAVLVPSDGMETEWSMILKNVSPASNGQLTSTTPSRQPKTKMKMNRKKPKDSLKQSYTQ
jgi:hypothetical protein